MADKSDRAWAAGCNILNRTSFAPSATGSTGYYRSKVNWQEFVVET